MHMHDACDGQVKTITDKITKGNMLKYFEQRRIKKQKKWEAEFDKAFKKFMKEEMYDK